MSRRFNDAHRTIASYIRQENHTHPMAVDTLQNRLPVVHVQDATVSPVYSIFNYSSNHFDERQAPDEAACALYSNSGHITWINMDGLHKDAVTTLCRHYGVHDLVVDDILGLNERAKMEENGNIIFCVLPMMFFNEDEGSIELEQVSIVFGKDFLLSFQEEATRDVFEPIRRQLRDSASNIRSRPTEYLCYSLLDVIVDSYFGVLEKLAERIEHLEDSLARKQTTRQLAEISSLRRNVMVVRRAVLPVREMVAHFVRSDHELLEDRHEKYFRDVLDHTIQANDFVDNHRDMLMNLQDLYMNQINLKMNEVMKVFTMVATLLAPATVIGGIFGMNFDVIPLQHKATGFYISVAAMFIIPVIMMLYFKWKGWY
jgi:magnesium transporter